MADIISHTTDTILNEQQVWEALKEVSDPELPTISVVDMGIIRRIELNQECTHLQIEMTPTFTGCPAIPQIRERIQQRFAALVAQVEVKVTFQKPWSSEHLSDEAREKLHQAGIAPPPHMVRGRTLPMLLQQSLICPYCGSQQTSMENIFGPTPCRAIAYCRECHQPFEQFKPL